MIIKTSQMVPITGVTCTHHLEENVRSHSLVTQFISTLMASQLIDHNANHSLEFSIDLAKVSFMI